MPWAKDSPETRNGASVGKAQNSARVLNLFLAQTRADKLNASAVATRADAHAHASQAVQAHETNETLK